VTTTALDSVIAQLAATGPCGTTFLTGAGISMEPPSSLPSAWVLTRHAFDLFFARGSHNAFDLVMDHQAKLDWIAEHPCDRDRNPPGTRLPRLETILGVADGVLGAHRALRILDSLRTVPPNRQHRFFAHHLRAGGGHITANFDDCIERALEQLGAPSSALDQIHHFHGSVRDDPDHGTLGATLARIQGGFTAREQDAFTEALLRGRVLVVVGYSGSDFFDVDPLLEHLPAASLTGRSVVWVNHGQHPDWHLTTPEPRALQLLARAGARTTLLCGQTADFLAALADAWALPALEPLGAPTTWQPHVDVEPHERTRATLTLYRTLGLVGQVASMLNDDATTSACTPAELRWARSEVLWEQGRWGDLRKLWQHHPLPVGVAPEDRLERIGAGLWVQGRLLPAYLWLRHHRRRAETAKAALLLAETEGRTLEHLALIPGLDPLTRRLIRGYLRESAALPTHPDIQARRRLHDLSTSLEALAGGSPRQGPGVQRDQDWYSQAGSLLGYLNYEHRLLRDTFDPDAKPAALSDAYRTSMARYRAIGSTAGALRAQLLPGAERVFTAREYLANLLGLQYGPLHRARLAARFCLVRALYLLRRRDGA
jgi:hypothetical protein